MKKWFRRTSVSAAVLMMLSLTMLPREGAALPIKFLEPPGPREIGDPDGPDDMKRGGNISVFLDFSTPSILIVYFYRATGTRPVSSSHRVLSHTVDRAK